jgi:hypothetical protein
VCACSYVSKKTGRGPLAADWIKTHQPVMTAYKLCRAEFRYWGLQGKIERFIHSSALRKTMLMGHRAVSRPLSFLLFDL